MTAALRHCQSCGSEMHRQRAGARFCSSTCRLRAHRGIPDRRLGARQTQLGVRRRVLSVSPVSRVPDARVSQKETDKAVQKLPPRRKGHQIVPEETWSGMFRIRRPDGTLTDMVNLTRALDALAAFDEATS